jgi:Flp pilus assembly protein TadD
MRELPGITLACVDTANHALALRALQASRRELAFAQTLFITDAMPDGAMLPEGVELRAIPRLASRDDYSRFILKSLRSHIATPHVLLVQWDGYVVNPAAFDPAFAGCDYIGAKWFWYNDGMRVGNGGLSLRSRRFLDALQDPRLELADAEDVTIARTHRPMLERDYGIRFADEALADRFAFEAAYPTGMPFGFHGLYNFCRVVPQPELAALAPSFSDAIARSPQLGQLIRNCVALGQWTAAAALATRRLAALPGDPESRALLDRAEKSRAQGSGVGRNDPCPCGSGKRYKQCHGALGAPTASPRGTAMSTNLPAAATSSTTPAAGPAQTTSAATLAQQGISAHRQGDVAAAESAYRAALQIDPRQPHALHYLGVIFHQRGRHADALPLLQRSTAMVATEPEFHNNVGLVLAALDRNVEAVAEYRRTLELKPDHPTAANNLGLALQALNRVPEAITAFRQALASAPGFTQAHWNLALALLAQGDYANGWVEYEWRLRAAELGGRAAPLPIRRWTGEPIDGRTLLLTCEQGIGDAVQFIRFAEVLAARGVRVVVRAPAALCTLLATAPGVAATVADDAPLPASDVELPLLSLGRVLDVRPADLPRQPYLRANRTLVEDAQARIATIAPRQRRVGIAWAGSSHHPNDRRRSMPAASLAPLLALPALAWFSVQKGPREDEIRDVGASGAVARLPADAQWSHTAALIASLDAIVTVDTSVAHVAGALGKPVLLMLPYAADWRWGVSGERTPWYPTARLFRQPAIGDWSAVVAAVARALTDPSGLSDPAGR